MNKKLMAVAVAGALAAPAAVFAQASNVQIYGKLNLGLDNYSATGSTAGAAGDFKSRYRVYDSSSRLGFRGTENLGGGLNAVFLMESGVAVDTGAATSQNGGASSSAGILSSRLGHVGLQGGWGLFTFGKSNVWWTSGTQDLAEALWVNVGGPGISTGTFGRGMAVGVTRVSNTMQYTSPVMGGMNAVVSYSPNRQEPVQANANADGKLWGVTLQGTWGQFAGGLDWVKDQANSPAVGSQKATTGTKLRGGWTYRPGASVNLLWVRSKLTNGGAAPIQGGVVDATASSLQQDGWIINWDHLFGNVRALAQWGKMNNITGCQIAGACNNTNMTGYFVGANYLFSKRTWMYLTYGQIRNASNYNQDYIGSGLTAATGPGPGGLGVASLGADPRLVAIGMIHNF